MYTHTYALRVVYDGIDVRARTLVSHSRLSHSPLTLAFTHTHALLPYLIALTEMHVAHTHTHGCLTGGDASRPLSDTPEAQYRAQVHT